MTKVAQTMILRHRQSGARWWPRAGASSPIPKEYGTGIQDPAGAAVEGAGVPREQAPHAAGEGTGAGADQQVRVGREEGPGVDGEGGPATAKVARRAMKSARSVSFRKMVRRSRPRAITWCIMGCQE